MSILYSRFATDYIKNLFDFLLAQCRLQRALSVRMHGEVIENPRSAEQHQLHCVSVKTIACLVLNRRPCSGTVMHAISVPMGVLLACTDHQQVDRVGQMAFKRV